MTFNNLFLVMAICFAVMLVLAPLLKRPAGGGRRGGGGGALSAIRACSQSRPQLAMAAALAVAAVRSRSSAALRCRLGERADALLADLRGL